MKTNLRYLSPEPDQRGNERYYVRMKGKRIRIREVFKDASGNITGEFLAAYYAAVEKLRNAPSVSEPPKPREETFNWLCDQYYRSAKFQRFDAATQRDKRSVLGRFCEKAGELPYKKYRKEDMERSQLARKATPGAADKLVKYMRALFNWAIEAKHATRNPCDNVRPIKPKGSGFHTWTESEIDQFRAYWPIGSKPRLAMEIMINVGARRSDAAQVGPRNEVLIGGERWLRFTAYKGRNRYPVEIEAKITDELKLALAATESGSDAYIQTQYGRPYVIESFGNAFSDWCAQAGLPHCSCHGLRKAAAVAFAESGASASQLMEVFGWTNMKTAQIYVDKANKRKLRADAYEQKARHQKRESVSLLAVKRRNETNEAKND